ncbi:hypothetical protein D187_006028 [Cystobacter fuscus DSM 2262]|uniref:Uncharacterized protein n=1 Tax=Cystobacter fuscus (strain ATCC 25194 / DSM 2262 / NBRC 100088 / M29) TaxID=1242864 RepID=S9PH24_CYSF2|nr:hypothetical protein D187_006028 [Cystobacter fuscus DSM 2262]
MHPALRHTSPGGKVHEDEVIGGHLDSINLNDLLFTVQ